MPLIAENSINKSSNVLIYQFGTATLQESKRLHVYDFQGQLKCQGPPKTIILESGTTKVFKEIQHQLSDIVCFVRVRSLKIGNSAKYSFEARFAFPLIDKQSFLVYWIPNTNDK